jgi:hypothetical protein
MNTEYQGVNMIEINNLYDNDLTVEEEVLVYGTVIGNIIITSTGTLILYGHCKRVVIIEDGGEARIVGKVDQYVINLGGQVVIDDTAQIGKGYIHVYGKSFGKIES